MADKSDADGGLRELALFAGAGGGILGGTLLGWRTVCAVEIEPYAASVLVARQNDGILPPFPIWDDIRTFDGTPWRGIVDVVSGGFPCQDISSAGKGAGITGERSGLWKEMERIIREVRPKYVFVENSPMLTVRGLGTVLGDLAEMGFNARWGMLGASDCGASHIRKRIWIFAYSMCEGLSFINETGNSRSKKGSKLQGSKFIRTYSKIGKKQWSTEPNVDRVANGIPSRIHRIKALGNAQVPIVAATAWRILSGL